MRTEPLMKFQYEEKNGMKYPNLRISDENSKEIQVGQFGKLWKAYMMEKYPVRVGELIATGRMEQTMLMIDEEAEQYKETMIQSILNQRPIPKEADPLERAKHMNQVTITAEERTRYEFVMKPR
ncbi:MAG: TnpV protein [Clostridiales bacterium]|nr:TnpV protein [Clostridiales bacterium]